MKVKELIEFLHEKDQDLDVILDLYVLPGEILTKSHFDQEGSMLLIKPKSSSTLSNIYDKIEELYDYTTLS